MQAALEFLLQTGRQPDILHCHDWSTAILAETYWCVPYHCVFKRTSSTCMQPCIPLRLGASVQCGYGQQLGCKHCHSLATYQSKVSCDLRSTSAVVLPSVPCGGIFCCRAS